MSPRRLCHPRALRARGRNSKRLKLRGRSQRPMAFLKPLSNSLRGHPRPCIAAPRGRLRLRSMPSADKDPRCDVLKAVVSTPPSRALHAQAVAVSPNQRSAVQRSPSPAAVLSADQAVRRCCLACCSAKARPGRSSRQCCSRSAEAAVRDEAVRAQRCAAVLRAPHVAVAPAVPRALEFAGPRGRSPLGRAARSALPRFPRSYLQPGLPRFALAVFRQLVQSPLAACPCRRQNRRRR